MRCGNNWCKDYIDNLYTWLIEVMLNCSSEFHSFTEKKSRVQYVEFKSKRTGKEVN